VSPRQWQALAAACLTLCVSSAAWASPPQLQLLVERRDVSSELKREVIDAYFAVYLSSAEVEWHSLLLEQALELQALLHEEPNVANEEALRASLIADEIEWRMTWRTAVSTRKAQASRLESIMGNNASGLLREVGFAAVPYDRMRIEVVAYASALGDAERELAERKRQLARATKQASVAPLGSHATGFAFTDKATARSEYALAHRRHDEALSKVQRLQAATKREVDSLLSARDHIRADLALSRSAVPDVARRASEGSACVAANACSFDEALGAYREAVALMRLWLRLHADAAALERQAWMIAANAPMR
jgi:hypothetical protein